MVIYSWYFLLTDIIYFGDSVGVYFNIIDDFVIMIYSPSITSFCDTGAVSIGFNISEWFVEC